MSDTFLTTDTMVGRVALAMDAALLKQTGGTLPDHLFALMARACIETIRDQPSPAMIHAFHRAAPPDYIKGISLDVLPEDRLRAMMDAALKEQP